jgi:hypothetical protein
VVKGRVAAVHGISDAPHSVRLIMKAVDNDLQGLYKVIRRVYSGDGRDPHKALLLALDHSVRMNKTESGAVARFLKGRDSEEAAEHGQLIHDRLLAALEAEDADALKAATFP